MGVPLHHPFYFRNVPYKPSILGYPHLWKPRFSFFFVLRKHQGLSQHLSEWREDTSFTKKGLAMVENQTWFAG